jgi:hypothetical protein
MKLSATSTLFFVAISGAISAAEATGILLLADKNVGDAGVDSLIAALVSEGHEVDVIFPEHSLTPEALQDSGHTCVIHLDGNSWGISLSEAADVALVDMVQGGGGYIAGQWMGYEHKIGQASGALDDLVLLGYGDGSVGGLCGTCNRTLSAVPAQSGHQLLASVPASFSFYADAFDATPLSIPHADQVTIMTYGAAGGVGVTTRPLGDGHSVNFAWAAGYAENSLTLQDLNVQQLYKNAVNYACEPPSTSPSTAPSDSPSMALSDSPSKIPSAQPSTSPSTAPSDSPSKIPSAQPSTSPSTAPSLSPSDSPSMAPSDSPSKIPSAPPSTSPSTAPSDSPSMAPSDSPSKIPSAQPSTSPSTAPSLSPSDGPSMAPSSISDRIEETCPCDPLPSWKNHGKYVKCVAHLTDDLVELGALTEAEKGAIVSASAQSECGHKKSKKTLLRG